MTQFVAQAAGNSEAQQRLMLAFLLAQDSVGIAKDGVLSGLKVRQTPSASGSVIVPRGAGVAQDSLLAGPGLAVNDTDQTLDIFTSNPVGGLPRNDLIVFDTATIDRVTGLGGLRPIIGVPNADPQDPGVPATALALSRLRHPAGAVNIPTSRIDDLRTPTQLFGRATIWGGYESIPASNSAFAQTDITFPAGFFTAQPVVQVSRSGQAYDVTYSSVDATKFTATASRKDGANVTGNVSFSWIAIQLFGI